MSDRRTASVFIPVVLGLAALWSALPLAVWFDGADPSYFSTAWGTWGWGSVLALLATALLLVVTRGRITDAALRLWRVVMAVPAAPFAAAGATLFAALALLTCLVVFDGNPRNVDGFAQLFQARIFLSGRLWVPLPAELANFATLQMVLGPDRWYSQYPFGQSLLLAASLKLGAWWLYVPPVAAGFALAVYRLARWTADEATARLALVLLSASPFVVAVAGSEMSHLGAAALGMGAAAAAAVATERRPLLFGAVAGAALGVMTAFRPLDAVAAAVPVGVILLAWAPRRVSALVSAALAGLLCSAPTLLYNARTTGHWREFGYTALWGPQHSLGFHEVPWGVPLTFARAFARSGLDLHQLNLYLFDATLPALLVIAAGFAVGRGMLSRRDAVPLVGAGALIGLLFFYWHRDVFYGPRFLYSIVGWCVPLFARAMVLLRRSGAGRPTAGPAAALFVSAALVLGLLTITPGRMRAYRQSTPIFGLHPARDAARAGITGGAVVLIPDGWGSRLIARMWQAGVPVRRSTRLYASIDACTLEDAVGAAERDDAARRRLPATLDSLAALGRPGARAGITADANLRLRTETPLSGACDDEIAFDRRGYFSFAPYLWLNAADLDGPIVWARDLGAAGNAALRARYPARRFYRYVPGPDGHPSFAPLEPGPGAPR